jgi:1-deoxy-D-xylulose-5-phosphate reductoisomerase
MTFKAPDMKKYKCIPLAYEAGRIGGTMTACLNAANERANEIFREGKLSIPGIPRSIEFAMEVH